VVTSSVSSVVMSGRIEGSARARRVFPEPGGPERSRLCAPAAEISNARLAWDWPLIAEKSMEYEGFEF